MKRQSSELARFISMACVLTLCNAGESFSQNMPGSHIGNGKSNAASDNAVYLTRDSGYTLQGAQENNLRCSGMDGDKVPGMNKVYIDKFSTSAISLAPDVTRDMLPPEPSKGSETSDHDSDKWTYNLLTLQYRPDFQYPINPGHLLVGMKIWCVSSCAEHPPDGDPAVGLKNTAVQGGLDPVDRKRASALALIPGGILGRRDATDSRGRIGFPLPKDVKVPDETAYEPDRVHAFGEGEGQFHWIVSGEAAEQPVSRQVAALVQFAPTCAYFKTQVIARTMEMNPVTPQCSCTSVVRPGSGPSSPGRDAPVELPTR